MKVLFFYIIVNILTSIFSIKSFSRNIFSMLYLFIRVNEINGKCDHVVWFLSTQTKFDQVEEQ